MQPSEGYAVENGPPAGSRLASYMGASQSRAAALAATSTMNANVPSFIPSFAKLSVADSNSSSNSPLPGVYNIRPFVPASASNVQANFDKTQQQQFQEQLQGGTIYYFQNEASSSNSLADNPLDSDFPVVTNSGCFTYQGPAPHIGKFRPKGAVGNNVAQFISPELKLELVNRQLAMECRADPNVFPDLPQQVEHLNNLVPLEKIYQHSTVSVYKATSVRDGVLYCLRRIHSFRLQSTKQLQPLESWKKLINANVVQLREIIPHTKAFGDNSLVLLYDYHPLADSLKTRHFGRQAGSGFLDSMSGVKITSHHSHGHQNLGAGVVEGQLWAYVIQLSSALRAIHASGLAAKCIDLGKILVHGKNKIMLSCCGLPEILSPEHQNIPIQQQQLEDLHALGRVLLALATGNPFAARRDLVNQSVMYVTSHYSMDMKNLISYLLTPGNGRKSINEIMPMIGARFYVQLENSQIRNDVLENELSKELENGRLFRLLCKLNTIVERPEHEMDPSWAETGDRFLLKLFRDYVFHQVMESGKPWMDMAHIVQCLNKLDSGVPEKIELVSRDGDNLIIVSYGDLKRCIETAFRDLSNASSVIPRH